MIKSKTYNIVGDQIQAPELAYTSIYVVKKDGLQQDRFGADANRSYVYTPSLGRIIFSTEGEKAFVIYKETSPVDGPIPGVCIPVTIEDSNMQDAVVNVSYSKAFPLNGSSPYVLNVIQKPLWATVEVSLFGVVTVMGFPDVEGPETLEFSVSNCSGGSSDSVVKTFSTLPNADNIFISVPSVSGRITNVTAISYVITSGSFPVTLVSSVSGIHNDYTGIITVSVASIFFSKTLRLIKNGVQIQSIPVPSNGGYSFTSESYLTADIIQIQLN